MNKKIKNNLKKRTQSSGLSVRVYNNKGKSVGTETLADFGKKGYEITALEELRKLELAKIQTSGAKTRSERRGGGRKPWRQKGTGRARVGSVRSPLWRKGGVIHGPKKDRNYYKKVNKKASNLARNWFLAEKAKVGEIYIWDIENKDIPKKTKEFEAILVQLPLKEGSVVIFHHFKENPISAKNIPYIKSKKIDELNLSDLSANQNVIITKNAFAKIRKGNKK